MHTIPMHTGEYTDYLREADFRTSGLDERSGRAFEAQQRASRCGIRVEQVWGQGGSRCGVRVGAGVGSGVHVEQVWGRGYM